MDNDKCTYVYVDLSNLTLERRHTSNRGSYMKLLYTKPQPTVPVLKAGHPSVLCGGYIHLGQWILILLVATIQTRSLKTEVE